MGQGVRGLGRGHCKNLIEELGWPEGLGHWEGPQHLGSLVFPSLSENPEMTPLGPSIWALAPSSCQHQVRSDKPASFLPRCLARAAQLSFPLHKVLGRVPEHFSCPSPPTPGGQASHWKCPEETVFPYHTVGTHGKLGAC